MERDSLLEKIKTQDILFADLEKNYPGITQTENDQEIRYTILIVDDEKSIINSVKRMLMDDNYDILTASSGSEGIKMLKNQDVHLIISDQKMPGMDGLDFLVWAKGVYPEIMTLMMTAYADINAAADAINTAGIYKFILKPLDEDDFRITVKRCLELRQIVIDRNILAGE